MITNVGKFLRKLRIDRGETLFNMATKLDVSSSFLSAVENGKKKTPSAWVEKLTSLYGLSDSQVSELCDAIADANDVVEINVQNSPVENRQLAVAFARQFDSFDKETLEALRQILHKYKEG